MNSCRSECTEFTECHECNECHEPVTLHACVTRVCPCQLTVCDRCSHEEILVNTPRACCFSVGDCVCIQYNGAMTASLPPQISADSICRTGSCC